MHEFPSAFLHFDPPYPGILGGTVLHGWLVAKPGTHYVDLRAMVGTEVFPGIYGIPRQDLAEFFKAESRFLLAGFMITLPLPAGRHHVVVEALGLAGNWEPLTSINHEVNAPDAQSRAPDPDAPDPSDGAEMLRLLLRRMGRPQASPATEAADIVSTTPGCHHLRYPPRPFHGHLDQPRLRARSTYGRVPISGWVFHESLPIKRVFATTDLQAVQNLRFGRETAFLAGRPGASALATHCGYDGFLDVPAQLPQPVAVRVYAELEDGSWHLGSVASFAATDHESVKEPFARFSPLTFWRAWRALARAPRARGWSRPAGWQTIRQVWPEYSAEAPRPTAVRSKPTHRPELARAGEIHLFTHNLSHEGAPLFLLEYARELRRRSSAPLVVTSAQEGLLRGEFEALGASVRIVDTAPLLASGDAAGLRRAMQAMTAQVDLGPAGLVVANTLSTYWAVHLAHAAGRPALFYIHESTPPRVFFRGMLPTSAVRVAEETFGLAARVSFLTATTQRYYSALPGGANYGLTPGWIDLARIDAFRAAHPREALRARLGLAPAQKLVINVGTVCERKGQHLFARAVDLLGRDAPALAASAVFLMIGGRDTPYDRALQDFLVTLGRPNLRIVPETGDVYPYFGAADLFVCSSYEESFPRVILEAMAFALPIASPDVHGIPEIVRAGAEALLVPPGDTVALAGALQRLLADPAAGAEFGRRARARVEADFAGEVVLPRHLALARSVAPALF